MDPFAPKGDPRPLSGQTCGYKPATATTDCGRPGVWHVMWDAQLDNSVTCAEHMQLIQERWVYADRHPMTADCTMPGALWVYVNDKCYVPQTDLAAYERVITEAVHDMAEQAGIPLHLLDR